MPDRLLWVQHLQHKISRETFLSLNKKHARQEHLTTIETTCKSKTPEGRSATFGVQGSILFFRFSFLFFSFLLFSFSVFRSFLFFFFFFFVFFFIFGLNCCTRFLVTSPKNRAVSAYPWRPLFFFLFCGFCLGGGFLIHLTVDVLGVFVLFFHVFFFGGGDGEGQKKKNKNSIFHFFDLLIVFHVLFVFFFVVVFCFFVVV